MSKKRELENADVVRNNGTDKFTPYPASWLNSTRWEDEKPSVPEKPEYSLVSKRPMKTKNTYKCSLCWPFKPCVAVIKPGKNELCHHWDDMTPRWELMTETEATLYYDAEKEEPSDV